MNIINLLQNTRCHLCSSSIIKNIKPQKVRWYSAQAESEEIRIPKRIPRGPTDILKALAGTIQRDPTAPHFKYHDDPYLIPLSNRTKRMYALAQESGRKAAMWIKEQHPELFQHQLADPPIGAFMPRAVYDETDDVDEDLLQHLIFTGSINDAVSVYNLMLNKGIEVSNESKQLLLELACYCNENEQASEELMEERWFRIEVSEIAKTKKTWKTGGLAEKLFEELPPSPESYSAIIQGLAKYGSIEKAFQHYNLAHDQGLPLCIETYHALIKLAYFMADSPEKRWGIVESLLTAMNEQGLKPTVLTVNSVLYCLSRIRNSPDVRKYALRVVAEAAQFGVEPGLGTYAYLLYIFCQEKGPKYYILEDILDRLENKKHDIEDEADTNFFYIAMEKCRHHLKDTELAHRVNRLLWHGNNYNFIGNAYKESVFYRHYFTLLIQTDVLEDMMKVYDHLVPHVYVPETSVMEELVKTVTMNGAINLYSKVWTDLVLYDMYDRPSILTLLLDGMVLNRVPPSEAVLSEAAVKLSEIAWSVYGKVEETKTNPHKAKIDWTGKMLGDIMLLNICAGEWEKAKIVFQTLTDEEEDKVLGVPDVEAITAYMDACIANRDIRKSVDCLAYCNEAGYAETKKFAKKFLKSVPTSNALRTHVAAIVGPSVFAEDENEIDEEEEK